MGLFLLHVSGVARLFCAGARSYCDRPFIEIINFKEVAIIYRTYFYFAQKFKMY